jgi:hypothetical protein
MGIFFEEFLCGLASKVATSNDEVRGDSHWFRISSLTIPLRWGKESLYAKFAWTQ